MSAGGEALMMGSSSLSGILFIAKMMWKASSTVPHYQDAACWKLRVWGYIMTAHGRTYVPSLYLDYPLALNKPLRFCRNIYWLAFFAIGIIAMLRHLKTFTNQNTSHSFCRFVVGFLVEVYHDLTTHICASATPLLALSILSLSLLSFSVGVEFTECKNPLLAASSHQEYFPHITLWFPDLGSVPGREAASCSWDGQWPWAHLGGLHWDTLRL